MTLLTHDEVRLSLHREVTHALEQVARRQYLNAAAALQRALGMVLQLLAEELR